MKAGFWSVDVTPPISQPMQGDWGHRAITDYKSCLHVNAVVMENAEGAVAIASVEVCDLGNAFVDRALRAIAQWAGIPADRAFVNATHVHSGPSVTDDPDDAYSRNLVMQIATAVRMAKERMREVRVGVGRATNEAFVHNRRLVGANGEIAMNWLAPERLTDCVEDMQRRDTDVLALRFETPEQEVVGFVLNYSNHNNTLCGTEVFADIGDVLSQWLRKLYGPQVVTVLLLGACGDVNWIDFRDQTWNKNPLHYRRVAESMLGSVLDVCSRLEYPSFDGMTVEKRTFCVKERDFNDYDFVIDRTFDYQPQGGLEKVQATLKDKPLRTLEVRLGALRFGDTLAIGFVNGELFCEYALALKRQKTSRYLAVCGLADGYLDYIPTRDAYDKGGYEVRKPASYVPYDTGDRIGETLGDMLCKMRQ